MEHLNQIQQEAPPFTHCPFDSHQLFEGFCRETHTGCECRYCNNVEHRKIMNEMDKPWGFNQRAVPSVVTPQDNWLRPIEESLALCISIAIMCLAGLLLLASGLRRP